MCFVVSALWWHIRQESSSVRCCLLRSTLPKILSCRTSQLKDCIRLDTFIFQMALQPVSCTSIVPTLLLLYAEEIAKLPVLSFVRYATTLHHLVQLHHQGKLAVSCLLCHLGLGPLLSPNSILPRLTSTPALHRSVVPLLV